MKKRRQFRLRHRTQRSLGKKEKITTQKIGKYTARYCDILNRNNRKRQKKERYRAIKAESPAVYTKNTPTSDGSIGQRSGKTHKSGIRLAAYTQNPTHCTRKKRAQSQKKVNRLSKIISMQKCGTRTNKAKTRHDKQSARENFRNDRKHKSTARHGLVAKKLPSTRSKYAMPSFSTTIAYKCFTKCVKHWQKFFRF